MIGPWPHGPGALVIGFVWTAIIIIIISIFQFAVRHWSKAKGTLQQLPFQKKKKIKAAKLVEMLRYSVETNQSVSSVVHCIRFQLASPPPPSLQRGGVV